MPKRTDVAMTTALAKLRALGFEPDNPSEYQLKIGIANYYPVKGTVFVDGEDCRRDETGFEGLWCTNHGPRLRRGRDESIRSVPLVWMTDALQGQ